VEVAIDHLAVLGMDEDLADVGGPAGVARLSAQKVIFQTGMLPISRASS
jgi:hypothetical protein